MEGNPSLENVTKFSKVILFNETNPGAPSNRQKSELLGAKYKLELPYLNHPTTAKEPLAGQHTAPCRTFKRFALMWHRSQITISNIMYK